MKDMEKELLMEQYREQNYEAKANGLKSMTFAQWNERRVMMEEMFARLDAKRRA